MDCRREEIDLLSMDALKFCNEKYLICGSDSPGGKPAIVQIWDIDATTNLSTFPAHDTVSRLFVLIGDVAWYNNVFHSVFDIMNSCLPIIC